MGFQEAVRKSKKHNVQFFLIYDVHYKVSKDGHLICRFDWATGQDGNRYWFMSEDCTIISVDDILSEHWSVEAY